MKNSVLSLFVVVLMVNSLSAQRKGVSLEEQRKRVDNAMTEFVTIPGGKFMMGSSITEDGRRIDEKQHEVLLSPYAIQTTEVTQSLWLALMPSNPSADKTWMDYPVTNVSFKEVAEFITRLNAVTGEKYALPTEAQWEFAAKAGKDLMYGSGDGLTPNGWFVQNAEGRLHVVAESKPNEFGLYDMSGNVAEWCSDLYADYRLDAKDKVDPKGADHSNNFVVRGGSWKSEASECRSAARVPASADWKKEFIGFRLVKVLP